MQKLILFDFDGTLVDSQHAIVESVQLTAEKMGLAIPERPLIMTCIGKSLQSAIMTAFPQMAAEKVDDFVLEYHAAFHNIQSQEAEREPFFDGVDMLLETLKNAGHLMGVVTNKSLQGLENALQRRGATHYFSTLQTPDQGPCKPDPDHVLRAVSDVGGDPSGTIMVGDTVYDIQAAVAAGVHAVGVSWGYGAAENLRQAGAAVTVDSMENLITYIEGWNA